MPVRSVQRRSLVDDERCHRRPTRPGPGRGGRGSDRRDRGRDVAVRSTQLRQLHLIGAARLEQSAAQPAEQQAAEVLAELLGEERVEDGVDAAVHVRQRVGEDLERDDHALVGRRVELRTMLRHKHHLPTSIIVTDLYYWAQHDIANTARCGLPYCCRRRDVEIYVNCCTTVKTTCTTFLQIHNKSKY